MKSANEQIREKIEAEEYRNNAEYPHRADPDRQAKMTAYHQEDARRVAQFREDLEVAYETFRLRPEKREALWNKAWEHGHANGLSEVLWWYDDLVELTR